MFTIKNTMFYSILLSGCLQYMPLYALEKMAAKEVASGAAEVFAKVVDTAGEAEPYVRLALKAYRVGQEIRRHNFPTKEERDHALAITEQFEVATAKKGFQSCLMKNRLSTERDSSGRPIACQQITEMLRMVNGKNEVNTMTTIYNEYRESIANS